MFLPSTASLLPPAGFSHNASLTSGCSEPEDFRHPVCFSIGSLSTATYWIVRTNRLIFQLLCFLLSGVRSTSPAPHPAHAPPPPRRSLPAPPPLLEPPPPPLAPPAVTTTSSSASQWCCQPARRRRRSCSDSGRRRSCSASSGCRSWRSESIGEDEEEPG